ncbi:MAG TPA: TetR family transcriptional regulator [Actinomycetota bacterium]|jgi:AcrR family transcriptional regulator|nr:TetR family transcriptional regulator [Actinomycetota bacterium]
MEKGLRERKKEQTRQLIAETAWRLFADRGFERVTVAEVARLAQVAVATVFNYFPTKEDLFYYRLEAFETGLLEAIATRPVGQPALVAFRRYILKSGGLLAQVEAGDHQALERLRTVNRVIAASPALLAREQRALARTADALAALLAAETGAPAHELQPQIAANALIGVHRALVEYTRRRVLSEAQPARLAAEVRRLGRRAFALLEHGLGGYATRPARASGAPAATRG